MKRIAQIIKYFFLWSLVIYILMGSMIVIQWRTDNEDYRQADVIVVFGNKVHENGQLSAMLRERLDTVVASCVRHVEWCPKKIIVSGGFGKEWYREAEKMKGYLDTELSWTIQIWTIIVDNYGDNTIATVRNSLPFINSGDRVAVVSSYYHITRIVYLYEHIAHISVDHFSAKTIRPRDLYGIFREVVALMIYSTIGLV